MTDRYHEKREKRINRKKGPKAPRVVKQLLDLEDALEKASVSIQSDLQRTHILNVLGAISGLKDAQRTEEALVR